MIEDTTFIIDILRDNADALAYLDLLERENRPEKISSITVLEVYEGLIRSSASEARREAVFDVLDSKHIIAANDRIMRRAGRIAGELLTRGEQIDREDCIVAATALVADEPVVTRNTAHFERIDGLAVRSY